jgi:hypothetical protein
MHRPCLLCAGTRNVWRHRADPLAIRARRTAPEAEVRRCPAGSGLLACQRANHYGTPGYKVVKTILEKGLDQQTLLSAFDALAATYTEGGRFCRDTQTILQ